MKNNRNKNHTAKSKVKKTENSAEKSKINAGYSRSHT